MISLDIRVPENGSVVDVEGLVLESDSVTVLFGPNGAGKTTILRRLAGIIGGEPLLACSYQPQSPYLFRGLAGYNLGLGLDAEEASRGATLAGSLPGSPPDPLGPPAARASGSTSSIGSSAIGLYDVIRPGSGRLARSLR